MPVAARWRLLAALAAASPADASGGLAGER